jgi:hypothetical protein
VIALFAVTAVLLSLAAVGVTFLTIMVLELRQDVQSLIGAGRVDRQERRQIEDRLRALETAHEQLRFCHDTLHQQYLETDQTPTGLRPSLPGDEWMMERPMRPDGSFLDEDEA